jgi:hypothetical protein
MLMNDEKFMSTTLEAMKDLLNTKSDIEAQRAVLLRYMNVAIAPDVSTAIAGALASVSAEDFPPFVITQTETTHANA